MVASSEDDHSSKRHADNQFANGRGLTRLGDSMAIVKEHGKTINYYAGGSAAIRHVSGRVSIEAPTLVKMLQRWLKELF